MTNYLESVTDAFELVTDEAQMRSLFQTRLPGFAKGELVITACRLLRTRYRDYVKAKHQAKAFLSACYDLELTTPTGERGTQLLYLRARREGKSREEFLNAQRSPLKQPRFGEPLVHLAEFDMTVWAFPNDPAVPHLANLMDEQVLQHLPYETLGLSGPEEVLELTPQVLHYYPEERCTMRYRLLSSDRSTPQTLIGKTFKNDHGALVYARMRYFWERLQTYTNIKIARPLAYRPSIQTVWQEDLAGAPLDRVLACGNAARLLDAAAQALVLVHESDGISPVRLGVNEHLAALGDKVEKLAYAFPELAASLAALEKALKRRAYHLPPRAPRLIHGDFLPQQLLVCGNGLALLDFDELALGDPEQDIANFMVDLYVRGYDEALLRQFLKGYQAHAHERLSLERLDWHIAVQLLTRAYRLYRQHKLAELMRIKHFITLVQGGFDPEKGQA